MKNLRNRFNRFCYANRTKGIPNLMLFVALTNAVIYLAGMFDRSNTLYLALYFNRDLVLQGQVWRLFTGVFTSALGYGNPLLAAIGMYCYYSLGRALEYSWGTLRFNLFYLSGIVIMDVFAIALGGVTFTVGEITYYMDPNFYARIGHYLNLSLLIAYATTYPDAQFLFFFIIPVRAWIFGLIYLGLTVLEVAQMSYPDFAFPHNLFPLAALANYFLFVGADVKNIIPGLRNRPKTYKRVYADTAPKQKPRPAYTHRCTICGKTDVSHPHLEFRYCSKCNGYFCYCEEHIGNHTHVQ